METAQKPEVKISILLQKGLAVMDKVTAKDMTLNKNEMIDLLNFETAIKFIIDCEQKAEKAKEPILD
jgi:hypothetical protein